MYEVIPLRRLALAFLVLSGPLQPGYAMDFSLARNNPFDGQPYDHGLYELLLKGEIVPGDYERLLTFALTNEIPLLRIQYVLTSPGGDVAEALKIGQLLKSIYAQVDVGPEYGKCASACFIIFASAVERTSGEGLVGIHRPYAAATSLATASPSSAEKVESQALLDAEHYLHELHVPRVLVDEMFEHASTEIHWLSETELSQLGRRPPWYEEFLIARCGLDKTAEQRFIEDPTANAGLRTGMDEVFLCANDATLAEAKKNLRKALADYHQRTNALLLENVPDYKDIYKSCEYSVWKDEEVDVSGTKTTRGELLRDAYINNDATRVITFVKEVSHARQNHSYPQCAHPAPPAPMHLPPYDTDDVKPGHCYLTQSGGVRRVASIARGAVTYNEQQPWGLSEGRSSMGIQQFARETAEIDRCGYWQRDGVFWVLPPTPAAK